MSDTLRVLLLPGDGIGPEVIAQARLVLEAVRSHKGGFDIVEGDFGGMACDKHGEPLPEITLEQVFKSTATLLGAVGGPSYDDLPAEKRPEAGLLGLRKKMGVFANLRPVQAFPQLLDSSSLRPEIVRDLDIVIVRELIGGVYFAEPRGYKGEGEQREAFNTMRYSVAEIRRIAKKAFELAKGRSDQKVCSIDKANVLETSRLWREVVNEVAQDYPSIELQHMYVDNAAMQLVRQPGNFDVLLTCNIFGDILSDLAAEIVGSIGMLPSASLGLEHGLFEPIHGSAPSIAGKDEANPCAAILSAAMLLEGMMSMPDMAKQVRMAVSSALDDGLRTPDLCRSGETPVTCSQMGQGICDRLIGALKH